MSCSAQCAARAEREKGKAKAKQREASKKEEIRDLDAPHERA
jgi:hypothetical protein